MVAIVNARKSLRESVLYNERKVKSGKAVCLAAGNYPKDLAALSLRQKLARLVNQAALNHRVIVPSMPISLNFHPTEKIAPETLVQIADVFMEKIGFGRQPYLVYQHFDAGHPHLHIVTTRVGPTGVPLKTYRLGIYEARDASAEITRELGLFSSEGRGLKKFRVKPAVIPKLVYGQIETRYGISLVVEHVLKNFKPASLHDFNLLLGLYNVKADRCKPTTRTYQHNGLLYKILDENGKHVSAPIKASRLSMKPTLANLEPIFKKNELSNRKHAARITTAIDWYFFRNTGPSLAGLSKALHKQAIEIVSPVSIDEEKDLLYIDHTNKAVFTGRTLGAEYTDAAINQRMRVDIVPREKQVQKIKIRL